MVIRQQISIGEFGACIVAFGALQSSMSVFFTELGRMGEHMLFAADFFRFMDLPEEASSVMLKSFPQKIILKNVSFSYPAASADGYAGQISYLRGFPDHFNTKFFNSSLFFT